MRAAQSLTGCVGTCVVSCSVRLLLLLLLLLSPNAAARGRRAATRAPVTEKQILAHAERHAPSIAIARSRLAIAAAEQHAASALFPEDPELELAAGPRMVSGADTQIDFEVGLTQALELAGERGLRREVASLSRQNARRTLALTRWETHVRVHRTFHSALVARQRLRAAEAVVRFAEELLAISQRRQQAGAISGVRVTLVEGEVALSRQDLITARSEYETACLALASEAGWRTGAAIEPTGALERPRRVGGLRRIKKQVLQRHPKLLQLAAEIKAAEAQRALASRERLPKPSLGVSYSREVEGDGTVNNILLGTLSMQLPLWQRNRGPLARSEAQLQVARVRYQQMRQLLDSGVGRAAVRINAAADKIQALGRDLLPTLSRRLAMLGRAFEAGKIDALQVMVGRERLLAGQRKTLDAYDDYYSARAALALALGGEPWSGRTR